MKAAKGIYKATWKREFKLPYRDADPPNHHDDKVDSDQQLVNKEVSLRCRDAETVKAADGRGKTTWKDSLSLCTLHARASLPSGAGTR